LPLVRECIGEPCFCGHDLKTVRAKILDRIGPLVFLSDDFLRFSKYA
jgi:hypothetical protein